MWDKKPFGLNHSFETWPSLEPADLGLEPGRVDEKIEKVMTRCDSADPAG
jgi:hypothetical protein